MNLNQYADRIISILKKTPTDIHNSIWDALCYDYKIDNNNFSKSNIDRLDTVVMNDIQKFKQEDIIYLWKFTVDGDIHECSYLSEPPEYEGDMILDIKNETLELIMLDIRSFN